MNVGNILGSISPAFGIASGHGIFGNQGVQSILSPVLAGLMHHGQGGGDAPAPAAPPAQAPAPQAAPPQAPAVPGAPAPMAAGAGVPQKSAMTDGQPHGLAMDGKMGMGNIQGILGSLSMMQPKPMGAPAPMPTRWGY